MEEIGEIEKFEKVIGTTIDKWHKFECDILQSKLRISSMSFCAQLPEKAITDQFLLAMNAHPLFGKKKEVKIRKLKSKGGVKKNKRQKESDTTMVDTRNRKSDSNLVGAFIVTFSNNHVTVKFYRNGNIQICGCRSVQWLQQFLKILHELTMKRI